MSFPDTEESRCEGQRKGCALRGNEQFLTTKGEVMNSKIWGPVAIICFSTMIGAGVLVYQNNSPLMQRIVLQQAETVKLLKDIHHALNKEGTALPQQKSLESRLSAVEAKMEMLAGFLSGAQGARQQQQAAAMPQEDYTTVYALPVEKSPVRGPEKAKVNLVAFVDFQCPFSARFHPVINEVLAKYPKDVNYIIKHFPLGFHPQARPAAKAILAAGLQGKYWDMVDAVLKDNSNLSEQKYQELAQALGLNIEKFKKDLSANDAEWEKLLNSDMELGAKSNVRGTPMFFINGRKTPSRDLASFQKEIDSILQK